MNSQICLVLLTNDAFFDKMLYTLQSILRYGYREDVCIVIGNDLLNSEKLKHPLLSSNNIIIKYFPDIIFTDSFNERFNNIERSSHWVQKKFQYHKLHLFNKFFKQWNYIFYVDSGTTAFSSIYPILDSAKPAKFLAHSDAYPQYVWKLDRQFVNVGNDFDKLKKTYNLDIDYPQTTIMLYDTNIIDDNTFTDLLKLAEKYNFSMSNDQGIIALYFTCIKNCWEQIQLENENTWFYDYLLRPNKCNKPHILLKSL